MLDFLYQISSWPSFHVFIISGTRDNPSPKATLFSVYIWKRGSYRLSQSWPYMIIHNPYSIIDWILERNKINVASARVTQREGCFGYPRPYKSLCLLKTASYLSSFKNCKNDSDWSVLVGVIFSEVSPGIAPGAGGRFIQPVSGYNTVLAGVQSIFSIMFGLEAFCHGLELNLTREKNVTEKLVRFLGPTLL